MAMESGLSAAIINPNSEAMMRAYYSFNALMNLDPQCSEYISIYSGQTAGLGQTLEKVEMVPEVPVQPEMAVQGVQEVLEMPLKEV